MDQMKLSLITNNVDVAKIAENSGVDRVMIDLEKKGKAERQSSRNLFLSDHTILDIMPIRKILRKSELLVRIDPLHDLSSNQIKRVIKEGADMIMLPYFHSLDQAHEFISVIDGKAKSVLLVETIDSVHILKSLSELPGLSEIHIGLNDLSISLGIDNIFELFLNGTVDTVCSTMRDSNIPFGFGGIGRLDRIDLPINPELMLAEQVLQGATRGWLGRTFRDTDLKNLSEHVNAIRHKIDYFHSISDKEKMTHKLELKTNIEKIFKKDNTKKCE